MMVEREKIFFLDETGVQIFSRATYGRSTQGTRAIKRVKAIRSRNYSIATAMNSESLFLFEIQDKPYNSEDFAEFLNKVIHDLSLNGISGAYIIMDNVRFHKIDIVVNLIESHGHKAIFLSPYSLFLNPIENLFNQWKNCIKRSEPQNEDQLYESVHNASEKTTPENCANYCRNIGSYLSRCLNKEIIDD
jgi:transposase